MREASAVSNQLMCGCSLSIGLAMLLAACGGPSPAPPARPPQPVASVALPRGSDDAIEAPVAVSPKSKAQCNGVPSPELAEAIRVRAGYTQGCYTQALRKDPCVAGKFRILLRIEANGKVSEVSMERRGFDDVGMPACVEQVLGQAELPSSDSCTQLIVPISFKPKEPVAGCESHAMSQPGLTSGQPASACLADSVGWLQSTQGAELEPECRLGDINACQQACDKDSMSGCLVLAHGYATGRGVPRDSAHALAILEASCAAGYHRACLALGAHLVEGTWGAAKDLERAEQLFHASCRAGDPDGCRNLALLYGESAGQEREQCAMQLLSKGCDADHFASCHSYAKLLEESDFSQAEAVWQRLCAANYEPGCNGWAVALLKRPSQAERERGLGLLNQRCSAGQYASCNTLAYAYAQGKGVPADPARALALFQRICVQEYPNGCDSLAEAYTKGWGTPVDLAKANEFYSRACGWGQPLSCARVQALPAPP